MKRKNNSDNQTDELQYRAEAIAQNKMRQPSKSIHALSLEEIDQLIHELQVHQIELKMQNEELLRIQSDLDEAREHYFDLYNLAPVGYCTISETGLILEANLTAASLLGVAREALINQPISRFILIEDQDSFYLHRKQLYQTGEQQTSELRMIRNDKTVFWAHMESIINKQQLEIPSEFRIVLTDITEYKRARNTLRENEAKIHELDAIERSEKKFRLVFDNANDAIFIFDKEGRFLDVNPMACDRLGYSHSELMALTVNQINIPKEVQNIPDRISQLMKFGQIVFETAHMRKDGFPIPTEVSARRVLWDDQPAVISICRDLTERNQTKERLHESEDKFRLTFNFSPDSVNINRLDDGLYVDINEGFTRISGFTRDEVIGKTSLELNIWQDPADRQRLVQGIRDKGIIENLTAQFRRKDGRLIIGLMSARVITLKGVPHIITITRDITEHKKHENEQLKIEKLESLGILAGGIAHDFNNILTGIMGNISLAKVFLDTTHASYEPLAKAEKAAVRAGELAHQLLTFSRGGEPIKRVVAPKHLVNEALSFVLHGSNVKGTVDIPDSIHAIEADEGQISQVFQNIIINATQAMPGGGNLVITGTNKTLNDDNILLLPAGSYIQLTFSDKGCGISEENLERIFDPYFTTKSAGSGLGLASAYSIISRHDGYIGVNSRIGSGTTFTIFLPSIGEIYTKYHADIAKQTIGKHRGGSILVMDDDEMIREIASSMLTHLGYEVTVCANGEEAIELYKTSMENNSPFLMVIMDLTIPGGLGGKEAAEQILALFPKACLIVSSGYSNDPIMSHYREFGFSEAINKPYSIHEFEKVLGSLSLKNENEIPPI